jgi:hypothetical protein
MSMVIYGYRNGTTLSSFFLAFLLVNHKIMLEALLLQTKHYLSNLGIILFLCRK